MIKSRISLGNSGLVALSSEFVYHGVNSSMATGTKRDEVSRVIVGRSGFFSKTIEMMHHVCGVFSALLASVFISSNYNFPRSAHPISDARSLGPRFYFGWIFLTIRTNSLFAFYVLARFTCFLRAVAKNENRPALNAIMSRPDWDDPPSKAQGFKAFSVPDFVGYWLTRLTKFLRGGRFCEFARAHSAFRLAVVFHSIPYSQCISQYTTFGGKNV